MKVSLTGMFAHAATAVPACREELVELARRLRILRSNRLVGEAAIDEFVRWYLVATPIKAATLGLPKRATRRCAQPEYLRFVFGEFAENLASVVGRKTEGTAVIDEFFDVYVLGDELRATDVA